ncbi:T-cell surface glycoprotein CD8 alpha chain-like isoform X2 [Pithys albifrons albifrons]|uniref:T-cell surface glycoprotein CD8 alpha chain-like isoform X2 n=1 Tax=Pithys albifrons albifrons TaxID=3385563 RepID=UPI003A5D1E10
MHSSPALLLLLALGLCCIGIQGQHYELKVSFRNSITQLQGNQRTSRRFEACKDRRFYRLVVKSFTPQDEGHYFCVININEILYFSRGQPAFLPVTTTQRGTTVKEPDLTTLDPVTTTAGPTTQSGITKKDPCSKTTDPETSTEKEPNFFCNAIWVPLAGACLLLLIALAITILLCRHKTHHNSL